MRLDDVMSRQRNRATTQLCDGLRMQPHDKEMDWVREIELRKICNLHLFK